MSDRLQKSRTGGLRRELSGAPVMHVVEEDRELVSEMVLVDHGSGGDR